MMSSGSYIVLLFVSSLSVSAHFLTTAVIANNVSYTGIPDGAFAVPPLMASWTPHRPFPMDHLLNFPMDYSYNDTEKLAQFYNQDIICGINSTAGQAYIPIHAGNRITFQWSQIGHQGPIMTYLANCHGPCNTVDKRELKFFKIDESGYLNTTLDPEKMEAWGAGVAHTNNDQWTSAIPSNLLSGDYVIRHEIIGLQVQTPQFYPWCWNLRVQGTGTDKAEGIRGTELYKKEEVWIVGTELTKEEKARFGAEYRIPGPDMWSGATKVEQRIVTPTDTSIGISY